VVVALSVVIAFDVMLTVVESVDPVELSVVRLAEIGVVAFDGMASVVELFVDVVVV
jgi:hypothetical protein